MSQQPAKRIGKHAAQVYGLVVASVVIATLVRLPLMHQWGARVIFVTYFPAIIFSAWIGGWSGGFLATALAAAAGEWIVTPAVRPLIFSNTSDLVSFILFLIVGFGISAMGESQRRALQKAEQTAKIARTHEAAAHIRGQELAEAYERQGEIIAELQDALQPAAPERVGRMEVAPYIKPAFDEAAIGGDFYDVFDLDKHVYALIIGDVSGKGLAAAAQLATVRNMLRAALYHHCTLGEAIENLNRILTFHGLVTGFVTAFVGLYDASSDILTYVSCGHEPGLVRTGGAGEIRELEASGPPLGVLDNATYEEHAIKLDPGDTILLYTDGLSECGPDRRTLLGTEGICRILSGLPADAPACEQKDRILAEANSFSGGVFSDDVCLLFIRYV